MTTTAADIDAAYQTLRITTQYMTMDELDAHVDAVLAMAAGIKRTALLNLAPPVPLTPLAASKAQQALASAQQELNLFAAAAIEPAPAEEIAP